MDKDKLYYIIRPGTNERRINPSGEPLIVQRAIVKDVLLAIPGVTAMTISEFEELYGAE